MVFKLDTDKWITDAIFDPFDEPAEFPTREVVMTAADRACIEQGYVLLTEEEFDKLKVLV